MKIRVWLIAAALALLTGALAGCGGGGTGKVGAVSRALVPVTIKVQFPASSGRVASRVYPASVQSVSLEAFNGTVRVARAALTTANSTTTLQVPPGPLTFYANAYPDTTPPDNPTDPATGLAVASTADPSLARGVTTQEVPLANGQTLVFAMNNNVALLVPNSPAPPLQQPQPAAQPYQAVPLDNATGTVPGTLSLASLMSAKDVQGNTLMLQDSEITWQVDPADPLGAQKATVSGSGSAATLTLLGTGQVNLIATDTKVNSGQRGVQGVFPLLITPAAAATTLTANVTQIPLYARSVTVTASQNALNASDTAPAPVSVTTNALTLFPPSSLNVTVNLSSFKQSGRTVNLTAQAWSNSDGTGVLVGSYSLSQQTVAGSPFTMPLTSNVVGFHLSPVSTYVGAPASPGIYQAAAGSTTTPTTVTLQATIMVNNSAGVAYDTGQAVFSPTALQWVSDNPAAATVDANGKVSSVGPIPAAPVNITANDNTPPAANNRSGTIAITILSNSGSASAIIN